MNDLTVVLAFAGSNLTLGLLALVASWRLRAFRNGVDRFVERELSELEK